MGWMTWASALTSRSYRLFPGRILEPTAVPSDRWLPLLLAVGGLLFILLFGVLAYGLLRRIWSSREGIRQKDENRFQPLDVGATLQSGRFVVLDIQDRGEDLITYEVRDRDAGRQCPACGAALRSSKLPRCPVCGTATGGGNHRWIQETLEADRFASGAQIASREIRHPALLPPLLVFSEEIQGERRHYQVISLPGSQASDEFEPPQPPDRVMCWGAFLADGLAALHEHGATFGRADPELIRFDQGYPRWVCWQPLRLLEREERDRAPHARAADVRGVARWMLRRSTGDEGLGDATALPDPLAHLLTDALTATEPISAKQMAERVEQIRREFVVRADVRLRAGGQSDTGRVRDLNEDSMWLADYSEVTLPLGVAVGAFAVADGVGGHSAGDVASQLTVDVLRQHGDELRRIAEAGSLPEAHRWLGQAAEAANARVYAERRAVSSDMGSTLVMALFAGNEVSVLNVGDSRAYRLGCRGVRQITTDHSLVERLVAIGQITREEARTHPQRNVIYRVVGDRTEMDYDLYDERLAPGEALLLSSDGVTDMLTDRVIWQIWRESAGPQDACEQIVHEANRAGGHDNITVIIVQIEVS